MTLQAMQQLQAAVYAALQNDAGLMAQVNGIYDYVPEEAGYPYLVLSLSQARVQDNAAVRGIEAQLSIRGYSDEKGSKNVQDILASAHAVLVSANLVLSGFSVVDIAWQSSQLDRRSDGLVYAGVSNYLIKVFEE